MVDIPGHERPADRTLRIATLNIGSLIEPRWADRRFEIVAWLDRIRPDVVCFQEVWERPDRPNTAGWIADNADGDWHMMFGGQPFHPDLVEDQSLLFGSAVLSRWPIEESSLVDLPHVEPVDDDDLMVVRVPWELVHARTAGLDVFSVHLAAAPTHGRHRRLQVVTIDKRIREIRGDADGPPEFGGKRPAMPAVLCGDFNAEPESDEIRFLSSLSPIDDRTTFWQDAWRMAGEGSGFTQDWRTNPIADSMNINRKRIDYIFVGDPFQRAGGAGRVLDCRLVFDKALTGVLASDHFGLMADVVWPDRPDDG